MKQQNTSFSTLKNTNQILDNVTEYIKSESKNDISYVTGISTGFYILDKKIGGYSKEN